MSRHRHSDTAPEQTPAEGVATDDTGLNCPGPNPEPKAGACDFDAAVAAVAGAVKTLTEAGMGAQAAGDLALRLYQHCS